MDKASDFESEDCEFESRRGRNVYILLSKFFLKLLFIYRKSFMKGNWFLKENGVLKMTATLRKV